MDSHNGKMINLEKTPGEILQPPAQPIVGRTREQHLLREAAASAATGFGQLIVVSGQAGIGKTTLARDLTVAAGQLGFTVLTGSCYDLAYTSPFGPWLEMFDGLRRQPDLPPLPAIFAGGNVADLPDRAALFAEVRQFLVSLTAHRPALIVLEDLHWSDEESLDLLRNIGPFVRRLPVLLLATYRVDELLPTRPFLQHLPALVRESDAGRVDLRRLDSTGVRQLVGSRYTLAAHDEDRVVEYLDRFSEGNPFFAVELMRVLEEENVIERRSGAWRLGELDRVVIPTIVSQTIDHRITRLGEETRKALAIAAVIGQDVSLDLWGEVSGMSQDDLLAIVEGAVSANLLHASHDGTRVSFVHALTRESLYESMVPPRRRIYHQAVANCLLGCADVNADSVAYHLEKAGDPRAWEWMVESGHRAQRVYAWRTAIDRFRIAAELLRAIDGQDRARGWLLLRTARLMRMSDPRQAIALLDEAAQLAAQSSDTRLAGEVVYGRGLNRCYANQFAQGVAELTSGITMLNSLTPDEFLLRPELEVAIADALPEHHPRDLAADELATTRLRAAGLNARHGTLPWFLASSGKPADAIDRGQRFLHAVADIPRARGLAHSAVGHALHGLGIASAALGRPGQASKAFADAREVLDELDHHAVIAITLLNESRDVALTYEATSAGLRRDLATRAEAALDRAGGAIQPGVSPSIARLGAMMLDGQWDEAAGILDTLPGVENAFLRREITSTCCTLARHHGQPEHAWEQLLRLFPDGPATEPGNGIHQERLSLMRLAASLHLDAVDLPAARTWLEAHDRWLSWGQGSLGAADGQVSWSRFYQVAGQVSRARETASNAIDLATSPAQPLVCLGARRILAQLDVEARDFSAAEANLSVAIDLATACEMPFEQGLTLISMAELQNARGAPLDAERLLDDAALLLEPLKARPTLDRVLELRGMLGTRSRASRGPAALTSREREVLSLLVEHQTNKEIAAALFISPRTVQSHVENICTKLAVENRRQAAAAALRLGLV